MATSTKGGDKEDKEVRRPLPSIAAAFQNLHEPLLRAEETTSALSVKDFADACAEVSVLFGYLGIAFKFAEKDYVSRVHNLTDAARTFDLLPSLLDHDVQQGTVKTSGSYSRNLLRVRRGLEMVELLFRYFLEHKSASLSEAAADAYNRALAPHHNWPIRKAVGLGMHTLPSRSKFLRKINESDESWKPSADVFVASVRPIIKHVDNLFLSRNVGTNW